LSERPADRAHCCRAASPANLPPAVIQEKLDDNDDATAASAPRQSAERAAWVQAALVLLNGNEFLYVH